MTDDKQPDVDAFHAHLDQCARCANRPFDLCPTGAGLLAAAAGAHEVAPDPSKVKN